METQPQSPPETLPVEKPAFDAHVQFNGTHYQLYLTKQENLPCSTADCSECKEKSLELAKNATVEQVAEKEKIEALNKQKVDEAAKVELVQREQARIVKAARAKGEALRVVGLTWNKNKEENEKMCAEGKAKATEDFNKKVAEIDEVYSHNVQANDQARAKAEAEINAKDWLKETADAT